MIPLTVDAWITYSDITQNSHCPMMGVGFLEKSTKGLGESFVGDEYDLFTILTVVMVLWVHKLIKLPTLNMHSLFYVNFTSIPLFLRIISHIHLKNYYVSCLVFPFQHPVPSVKHPKSSLPQLKQAQLFPLNFYKQN